MPVLHIYDSQTVSFYVCARWGQLNAYAERLQYQSYLRLEQTNAAIMALARDGAMIKEIVRRAGHSRGLVRQVLKGKRNGVFWSGESSLETCLEWLEAQWAAGKRNATELRRRMSATVSATGHRYAVGILCHSMCVSTATDDHKHSESQHRRHKIQLASTALKGLSSFPGHTTTSHLR